MSVTNVLEAEKSKPCKIYRRICDMYKNVFLAPAKKTFTDKLNPLKKVETLPDEDEQIWYIMVARPFGWQKGCNRGHFWTTRNFVGTAQKSVFEEPFQRSIVISWTIHNKILIRIFEAAAISFCNSVDTLVGFYDISPYLSKSILNSYNIFHL